MIAVRSLDPPATAVRRSWTPKLANQFGITRELSQKLPAGPVSVAGVKTGTPVSRFGQPLEKITMWESFMYPEAIASGWFAPLIDQQDPMAKGGPFDVDDRGYIYGS